MKFSRRQRKAAPQAPDTVDPSVEPSAALAGDPEVPGGRVVPQMPPRRILEDYFPVEGEEPEWALPQPEPEPEPPVVVDALHDPSPAYRYSKMRTFAAEAIAAEFGLVADSSGQFRLPEAPIGWFFGDGDHVAEAAPEPTGQPVDGPLAGALAERSAI